jgi:2-isopropylmalate synthase
VDAAYKAIDQIVEVPNTLLEFSVHAVTEGIDAQGEVTVRIQGKDGPPPPNPQREVTQPRTYGGYGADTDIIVASVKAYLSALNKLLTQEGVSWAEVNLSQRAEPSRTAGAGSEVGESAASA